MQYEKDNTGEWRLTIETRREARIAAYAVSQARGNRLLERLPFRRMNRLVRSLSRVAASPAQEAHATLETHDSYEVVRALRNFSHIDVDRHPEELVHGESSSFVPLAHDLVDNLGPGNTAH